MSGPDVPPLQRPRDRRVIAGVAVAVADRLGIAPWIVRVITVILAFAGGLGAVLYLAGWLLIPEEGTSMSLADEAVGRLRDGRGWLGAGLIVLAVVVVLTSFDVVRSDLAWAVALFGVGILMYRGRLSPDRDAEIDSAGQPFRPDDDDQGERFASEAPPEPAASEPVVPAVREPRPARERSILGRLTIGTGLIVLGTMAVLDSATGVDPAFSHYMAAIVAVVGLGLLVGSLYGRSRGLIVLGLVLVPILLASSVVTADFEGGWGDPTFRPRALSEVDGHYTLTGGEMEIDLRRLQLDGKTVVVEGDVGFGRLLVRLPEGAGLDLTAHVGFGDLQVLGGRRGGVDLDELVFRPGDGRIVLDLDVGFGSLEIREAGR